MTIYCHKTAISCPQGFCSRAPGGGEKTHRSGPESRDGLIAETRVRVEGPPTSRQTRPTPILPHNNRNKVFWRQLPRAFVSLSGIWSSSVRTRAMADVVSGGGSSSVRWQDEADPELRPLVVKQLYVVVYSFLPQPSSIRDRRTAAVVRSGVWGERDRRTAAVVRSGVFGVY